MSGLSAINQGDALWCGSGIAWGKVLLDDVTPYLVASDSVTRARQKMGG